MQGLVDQLREEGHTDAWIVSINNWASEPYLDQYVAEVAGPVFQDGEDDPLKTTQGAATYNVWVVDRHARVRYEHAMVAFPGDEAVLLTELRALLDEP